MEDKSSKQPRKTPKQEGSLALVDSILTATTRILDKMGLEGFSTNKVADLAGVSIGSLYQYFPNKEALIGKLIEKHAFYHAEILEKQVRLTQEKPLTEIIEVLTRSVLNEVADNQKIIRIITSKTFNVDRLETIIQARLKMIEQIRDLILQPHYNFAQNAAQAEITAYFLINAMGGVAESILFDESRNAEFHARLIDEAVLMSRAYLEKKIKEKPEATQE